MRSYDSLETFSLDPFFHSSSSVVTIGYFDGVHRGHQFLLSSLQKEGELTKTPAVVLTFSNHPLSILMPEQKLYHLTSKEQKEQLISQMGISATIFLPFTSALSKLSARTFLELIQKHLFPSHLLLGYDAVLGHNREGVEPVLRSIANDLGIKISYLPPLRVQNQIVQNQIVSSRKIRQNIIDGQLKQAAELLGRAYEVTGIFEEKNTFNFDDFTLPPLGTYKVSIKQDNSHIGEGYLHIDERDGAGRQGTLKLYPDQKNLPLTGTRLSVIF